MDKELQNFINESKKVKLSISEKAAGKTALMDFVKSAPVAPASTTSTLSPPAFIVAAAGVAGLVAIVLLVDSPDLPLQNTLDVSETSESVIQESRLPIDEDGTAKESFMQSTSVVEEPIDDNYLYVEQSWNALPAEVSECVRNEMVEVLGNESSSDYRKIYDIAKEFCENEVNSTHEDVGEVSNESEIKGPFGPASNQ